MARQGLDVKNCEEIRRLKKLGFSKRQIARTLGLHRNTISKYFDDDGEVSQKKEISKGKITPSSSADVEPSWPSQVDWQAVRLEVLSGVPVSIIFEEHVSKNKVSVQYPAFWKQLQKRAPLLKATMVRVFKPGSRIEIDYCDGINLIDLSTGELLKTELFVGVLCSSRYTFAEFTLSQKSEDFLSSHVRMFDYFGGVSQVLSPDNLKSAVTKAHRYDPVINPAYTKLAAHYGFAVVPARVRTPQDKAIVERTIQIFQRWFFILVRNRVFTSLIELNNCLREHLVKFNQRRHRVFGKSRQEMFESEKEHLMPLPKDRYLVSLHQQAKLSRDCHLIFENNFYSAPHGLRGLDLDLWVTENSVEIYHKAERVAFHARSKTTNKFKTDNTHYPPEHQAYLEEDITTLKAWSASIGIETEKLISELLSGAYPLRFLRRSQSILGLSKRYSKPNLEAAIATANRFNQKTTHFIERVLKKNPSQKSGGEPIKRGFNPNLRGVEKIIH